MKYLCFKVAMIILVIATSFSCDKKNQTKRDFHEISLLDTVFFDFPIKRLSFKDQNYYSYNFFEKSLLKHDENFNILDTLGRMGQAPFENLLIRNYQVMSDGKVYIFDTEKHVFKIQDFSDSVYLYLKFQRRVERGLSLNDTILFTVADREGFKLNFSLFNLSDNSFQVINKLNELVDNDYSLLTHEGKLFNLENKVLHTAYFSDFWFVYDREIDSVNVYDYLFDFQAPEVLSLGGGIMLKDASEIILDSFGHGDFAFMISNVADKKSPKQRVLDVYRITDGKYLRSYILPNYQNRLPTEGFYMKDNQVGILYEDVILKLQLK